MELWVNAASPENCDTNELLATSRWSVLDTPTHEQSFNTHAVMKGSQNDKSKPNMSNGMPKPVCADFMSI